DHRGLLAKLARLDLQDLPVHRDPVESLFRDPQVLVGKREREATLDQQDLW
ncbi:hypothetical protein CHARACLAT_031086, partial [Characodon lateralis]|nr:hypothetical protein [Characodon lateralis]